MPSNKFPADPSPSALDALAASAQEAIHSTAIDVLKAAVSDPALNEDLALALLKRSDLPAEVLELLSKNGGVMKSRKLNLAVAQHPRTPRHVSLPRLRQLYTFDLMQVALAPVAPADIKKAAEEALLNRLESVSVGERVSLARRASGRVAGVLLLDPEARVMRAALENPSLTEAAVIKALACRETPVNFVHSLCRDTKWSVRREVRIALLRNKNTPTARALEFARSLPAALLQEVLRGSALPGNLRSHLLKEQVKQPSSAGRSSSTKSSLSLRSK